MLLLDSILPAKMSAHPLGMYSLEDYRLLPDNHPVTGDFATKSRIVLVDEQYFCSWNGPPGIHRIRVCTVEGLRIL